MHKCRGRLLLEEKIQLTVKLTVKSCADQEVNRGEKQLRFYGAILILVFFTISGVN